MATDRTQHFTAASPADPASPGWKWFTTLAVGLLVLYAPALPWAFSEWGSSARNSHGFLIPVVSGYLAWQERGRIDLSAGGNRWLGTALLLVGFLRYWAGVKGPFLGAVLFSSLFSAAGALALAGGWGALRPMLFPIGFLVFMIPVPLMFYNQVALPLQLGVASASAQILGTMGMSVFVEGNLIHTPNAILAVVNECSGLTYLTALLALAVLLARVTQRGWWARLLLVLFSIPVAVVANVARVTVGGLMAQVFGAEAGLSVLENAYGIAVFLFAGVLLLGISRIMDRVRGLRPAPTGEPPAAEAADPGAAEAAPDPQTRPSQPRFPRWIVSTMAVVAVLVFLGLNGLVVKSHGSANELGVATAIGNAAKMVRADLTRRIAEDLLNFEAAA